MKCHVCGAELRLVKTDLPFKLGDGVIVILKGLPVWQCSGCREYLIQDDVMAKIEPLLDRASDSAELRVVRYAA